MNTTDILRELDKITAALAWAEKHLTKDSESKAAVHMDDRVLYTPLCTSVIAAKKSALKLGEHFDAAQQKPESNPHPLIDGREYRLTFDSIYHEDTSLIARIIDVEDQCCTSDGNARNIRIVEIDGDR